MKRIFFGLSMCAWLFAFSVAAEAAGTVVIKDIALDTAGEAVKISVTANQPVQIETFKSDELGANYIVLDFMGTVYTKLPVFIDVNKPPVEKVSLVKGDDKSVQIDGEELYALDFLAINLMAAADYVVTQSQAVIDLKIGAPSMAAAVEPAKAVELTPPIVVSQAKAPDPIEPKKEAVAPAAVTIASVNAAPVSPAGKQVRKVRKEPAPDNGPREKKVKKVKPAAQDSLRAAVGSEQPARKRKAAAAGLEEKPARRVRVSDTGGSGRSAAEQMMIDRIVQETIAEKEQASVRIDELTQQLTRMQQELNLSQGRKSELEDKIKEILAKLDQLKNILDDEIKRRQALGQRADDLIAKRDAYVKAKAQLDTLNKQFESAKAAVDSLDGQVKTIKSQLESVQADRKSLEAQLQTISDENTRLTAQYEEQTKKKNTLANTIDELNLKIEKLRRELAVAVKEKEALVASIEHIQTQTKTAQNKLVDVQDALKGKAGELTELTRRFEQLDREMEAAVAEKFKIEQSQQRAKDEYEKIKKNVEESIKTP
ncbi:MAG: hypothetical protein NC924_07940 [Candidatus Omnitrophica bacterium]|nr:hypothetical protein [Candidatus Omnitrophota bacterium]